MAKLERGAHNASYLLSPDSKMQSIMAKDAPKMKGVRPRDTTSGKLRRKRADTKIKTLHKKYQRRFAGHDSWQLGTLLKKWKAASLKKVLKRARTHKKNNRPRSRKRK